jgi:ribosomal protein L18E
VSAHRFTAGARQKIEAAGGRATLIERRAETGEAQPNQ